MPVKNALTAADANSVGAAFRDRLAVIETAASALESRPIPTSVHAGTEPNEPRPDLGEAVPADKKLIARELARLLLRL